MTKDSIRSETSLFYEEIIWNNRKILIIGKPVFYKSWLIWPKYNTNPGSPSRGG